MGNYGFLNFMIIAMLSVLDDCYFISKDSGSGVNIKKIFSYVLKIMRFFNCAYHKITLRAGKLEVEIREFLQKKTEYINTLRQMIKLAPFIVTILISN